jgi:hypothetical protein
MLTLKNTSVYKLYIMEARGWRGHVIYGRPQGPFSGFLPVDE